jgi:hypothetical protein
LSERSDWTEPTDEDVAAIAAVLFSEQPETIQSSIQQSGWIAAGRLEAVEKWEQPNRLSRIVETREI